MNTLSLIPLFKAGRHRDMNGAILTITEVELQQTASIYQPARHEAPLVIGHPQHDAPAWGWVSALTLKDGVLLASVQQVDPAFLEILQAGRYKKVSASFYTPDAVNNPTPGHYYLRHVGFLGAQPPAIKGLAALSFEERAVGVVTFTHRKSLSSPLFEGRFPPTDGLYDSTTQQENTMADTQVPPVSSSPPVPEALAARQQALDQKESELAQREAALLNREKAQSQERLLPFIDGLIQEGRILPRDREGLVALMARLAEAGTLQFSEGGEEGREASEVQAPAADYFQTFLSKLPVQVDFSEATPDRGEGGGDVPSYLTPNGYQVDRDGLSTHHKILSYAKNHHLDYLTAALRIGQ